MTAPTIAKLKSMGVTGMRVTCVTGHCRRSAQVEFATLGIGDGAPFPSIPERRRFTCSACGGHAVTIMPDWRHHKAVGIG